MNNYDFFISHASEDKDAVARPIATELSNRGFRVWFDEVELVIGDSLTKQINSGLAKSRFGVVILSDSFLSKQWPQMELAGLIARMGNIVGRVVLPVWHGITIDRLLEQLPTVADLVAISTESGIENVTSKLIESIGKLDNDKMYIDGTWHSKDANHELYISGWSQPTVGVYQLGGLHPHGIYRGVICDDIYHYKWNWIEGNAQGGGRLKYSSIREDDQLTGEWWYQNSPQSRIPVSYTRVSKEMPSWLTLSEFKAIMYDRSSNVSTETLKSRQAKNVQESDTTSLNLKYQIPELSRNGDFILLIRQMLQDNEKELQKPENVIDLKDQLDNLLSKSGIDLDRTYNENIEAIVNKPIMALRVASVAKKIAFTVSGKRSKLEQSLNILRRDTLLGVASIQPSLETEELERCTRDYKDLMFCIVGAMSDVASSASKEDKPLAIDNYNKVCAIVFR